ncbi:MAG: pseudouridine synthase [Planctomycetota bacterium]|nr:pseudouridine synthase [Planctomycetota bacterium]MDA1162963.1 pseudouridine synthase [Planctomycetota bacterium]
MATASKDSAKSESVRLQVLLARCGLGSRRACEDYITTGRVTIDGVAVTELGARVDLTAQKVTVDGESIRPERPVCYMVNKPKGMLCTNSDPSGRSRVVDIFPTSAGRVFPIGRLDENSVGLLLVTNDGELSHRLAHPRFKVPKVYEVQVAGRPSTEILNQLREGMYFSDGRFKVDNAKKTGTRGKSTILEVTLSEGKNREIRRLFSRVGHKVMKLERVAFGPLQLRGVPVGRFRALSREEMKLLRDYIENGERRADAVTSSQVTKNTSKKAPAAARKPRDRPERRVVEVVPFGTAGGHDLTGRKRPATQQGDQKTQRFRDNDDDESTHYSGHPAIVNSKKAAFAPAVEAAARSPQRRKVASPRPFTEGKKGNAASGKKSSSASGQPNSSKRSAGVKKAARPKPTNRKRKKNQ